MKTIKTELWVNKQTSAQCAAAHISDFCASKFDFNQTLLCSLTSERQFLEDTKEAPLLTLVSKTSPVSFSPPSWNQTLLFQSITCSCNQQLRSHHNTWSLTATSAPSPPAPRGNCGVQPACGPRSSDPCIYFKSKQSVTSHKLNSHLLGC